MSFRIGADLVVLAHFAFVLFVVLGGLLVYYRRWWAWAHLPAALWGAIIEFTGMYCPLTPLEKWLRLRAGEAAYEGGFIAHYMVPIIYPAGLTRPMQIGLGVGVVMLNLAIYGAVLLRRRRGVD
jgi:hypothetical protein